MEYNPYIVECYVLQRDEKLEILKANLAKAQYRMKRLAYKAQTDDHFELGYWVNIKLIAYRQNSGYLQKDHKLGRKYSCPSKVIKCIGSVAYKLEFPAAMLIHPVFHISMLKRRMGKSVHQVTPLLLSYTITSSDTNLEDMVFASEGNNVVNDKVPAEVDVQASRDILGRGQKIKMSMARLAYFY